MDRFRTGGHGWFLKTYRYPLPFGPLRGMFRNTFLAPSRARREWRALQHLAGVGLQPPLAGDLDERRRLGFLVESRLLTVDFGGEDLAARLARHPLADAEWDALATFVRGLHESGLRDPDLFARNVLIRHGPGGAAELAKIDAGASVLARPGPRWDRRRVADLDGLATDLLRLGAPRRRVGRLLVGQWFPGRRPARLRRRASARGSA